MRAVSSIVASFRRGGLLAPGRLLWHDLHSFRRRYVSDWLLFNQQIFASAVYLFFTNILPGITFASDLYVLTGKNWGAIEVVFSTGLCGVIFALFSAQPLTILGVTGPFSILAENIYELCHTSFHIPFLPFMAWCFIHCAWMHYLLAIFNAHDYTMRYVTTFSTEIFALLNSVIYVHKAVQELQRAHDALDFASFLYSIIGCIGTFLLAVFLSTAEKWAPLFHRYVRLGLREYSAAIAIIVFIGIPYGGELAHLNKDTLPVSTSFRPTDPQRSTFYVPLGDLPVPWIFAAMVPGIIISILFYFDHEVSSIICTIDRYGVRKEGGYAWDIVLLGTTTAICGILGIPPANGLLPQAPLHSESLMHDEKEEIFEHVESQPPSTDVAAEHGQISGSQLDTKTGQEASANPHGSEKNSVSAKRYRIRPRVYEQRWSHFLHAGGIIAFVSPPLMHVLGLTPTSVLAGLFLFMGEQSLSVNPILYRTFNLLTPPSELPKLPPTVKSWIPIHLYTISQIVITGIIFGVTLTVAGPAFPVIIIALVPIRLNVMNRLWNRETLRYVDAWACRDGCPEDDEDAKRMPEAGGDGAGDEDGDGFHTPDPGPEPEQGMSTGSAYVEDPEKRPSISPA